MRLIPALCCLLLAAMGASACAQDDAHADARPFDAVLIDLFGTTDTDAYLVGAERAASEVVVTCMAEAGFDFEIPPAPSVFVGPDPSSLDDARDQGFGIIAGFRHQIAQGDVASQTAPDPNVAYLSTLTRAEVDRFFLTLDGVEAEPGQRQENGGCNGLASELAYADWARFSTTLPNYTTMAEERDTHPNWVAARAVWQSCMTERGFDYSEPDVIRVDVISRMRDAVNEVYPGGQVPLVEQDGRFVLDPAVDALLEELVDFETAAAVANVECTAPIADEFASVEDEVQRSFVERNQAAIDELLAAAK